MLKRLLALIVLGLLVVACGESVRKGVVIAKDYEPAHSEMEWVTRYRTVYRHECRTVSSYNYSTKSYETRQDCGSQPHQESYQSWETVHYPDKWSLELEDCKPEGTKDKKGRVLSREDRCKTGWVRVNHRTFNNFNVGDYYGNDGG